MVYGPGFVAVPLPPTPCLPPPRRGDVLRWPAGSRDPCRANRAPAEFRCPSSRMAVTAATSWTPIRKRSSRRTSTLVVDAFLRYRSSTLHYQALHDEHRAPAAAFGTPRGSGLTTTGHHLRAARDFNDEQPVSARRAGPPGHRVIDLDQARRPAQPTAIRSTATTQRAQIAARTAPRASSEAPDHRRRTRSAITWPPPSRRARHAAGRRAAHGFSPRPLGKDPSFASFYARQAFRGARPAHDANSCLMLLYHLNRLPGGGRPEKLAPVGPEAGPNAPYRGHGFLTSPAPPRDIPGHGLRHETPGFSAAIAGDPACISSAEAGPTGHQAARDALPAGQPVPAPYWWRAGAMRPGHHLNPPQAGPALAQRGWPIGTP